MYSVNRTRVAREFEVTRVVRTIGSAKLCESSIDASSATRSVYRNSEIAANEVASTTITTAILPLDEQMLFSVYSNELRATLEEIVRECIFLGNLARLRCRNICHLSILRSRLAAGLDEIQ